MQIAHTFLLGDKYSKPIKATYTDSHNQEKNLEMGCYGFGLTRLIAASIQNLSTDKEIRWPKLIAPYSVCILPPKVSFENIKKLKKKINLKFIHMCIIKTLKLTPVL